MAMFRDLAEAPVLTPVVPAPSGAQAPTPPITPLAKDVSASPTADTATEAKKPAVVASPTALLAAFALIVVGTAVGTLIRDASAITFTPPEGVGILALFYILAQTIERLQEPIAPFLGRAKDETETDVKKKPINQPQAKATLEAAISRAADAKKFADLETQRAQALAAERTRREEDIKKAEEAALEAQRKKAEAEQTAANAQRTVDQIRANLSVIMFGVASAVAMLAAGYFGAFLLTTVGVQGAVDWVDILITGLAIGAGTKPLHDLISNIKESKEKKQDPAETS